MEDVIIIPASGPNEVANIYPRKYNKLSLFIVFWLTYLFRRDGGG